MLLTPENLSHLEKHDIPVELFHHPLAARLDPDGLLHGIHDLCLRPSDPSDTTVRRTYASLTEENTCRCLRTDNNRYNTLWFGLSQTLTTCAALSAPPGHLSEILFQQLTWLDLQERKLDTHLTSLTRSAGVHRLHDALTRMFRRETLRLQSHFQRPEVRDTIPVLGAEGTGTLMVGFTALYRIERSLDTGILALLYAYQVPTANPQVRVMLVPGRHHAHVQHWLKSAYGARTCEHRMLSPSEDALAEVAVTLWDPSSSGLCQSLQGAFEAAEQLCATDT